MPEFSTVFNDALRRTLRVEGEYSDHPSDPGGETRWGIRESVARTHGYEGDMQDLPIGLAKEIYWDSYWTEIGGEHLAEWDHRLAEEVFDTAVNMGTSKAITFLQRSLAVLNRQGDDYQDIRVDGLWGPNTRGALDAFLAKRGDRGVEVLLRVLNGLQTARYVELAEEIESLEDFVFGWILQRVR